MYRMLLLLTLIIAYSGTAPTAGVLMSCSCVLPEMCPESSRASSNFGASPCEDESHMLCCGGAVSTPDLEVIDPEGRNETFMNINDTLDGPQLSINVSKPATNIQPSNNYSSVDDGGVIWHVPKPASRISNNHTITPHSKISEPHNVTKEVRSGTPILSQSLSSETKGSKESVLTITSNDTTNTHVVSKRNDVADTSEVSLSPRKSFVSQSLKQMIAQLSSPKPHHDNLYVTHSPPPTRRTTAVAATSETTSEPVTKVHSFSHRPNRTQREIAEDRTRRSAFGDRITSTLRTPVTEASLELHEDHASLQTELHPDITSEAKNEFNLGLGRQERMNYNEKTVQLHSSESFQESPFIAAADIISRPEEYAQKLPNSFDTVVSQRDNRILHSSSFPSNSEIKPPTHSAALRSSVVPSHNNRLPAFLPAFHQTQASDNTPTINDLITRENKQRPPLYYLPYALQPQKFHAFV